MYSQERLHIHNVERKWMNKYMDNVNTLAHIHTHTRTFPYSTRFQDDQTYQQRMCKYWRLRNRKLKRFRLNNTCSTSTLCLSVRQLSCLPLSNIDNQMDIMKSRRRKVLQHIQFILFSNMRYEPLYRSDQIVNNAIRYYQSCSVRTFPKDARERRTMKKTKKRKNNHDGMKPYENIIEMSSTEMKWTYSQHSQYIICCAFVLLLQFADDRCVFTITTPFRTVSHSFVT